MITTIGHVIALMAFMLVVLGIIHTVIDFSMYLFGKILAWLEGVFYDD